MNVLVQGSTTHACMFLLVSSTDHIAPVLAATPTVTISKDGGAFAVPVGAVTEVGSGWYKLAANATDRDTVGELVIHATATGADPTDAKYVVIPTDPYNATSGGIANVGKLNFTNVSGVDYVKGDTIYAASTLVKNSEGTAQAVSASSITLDPLDKRTPYNLVGWEVEVVSATTFSNQRALITAYNTGSLVATVAWPAGTPTGVVTYNLFNKTGYSLSPTAFDAIPLSVPGGPPTTFTRALVWYLRRFFYPMQKSATAIKWRNDANSADVLTQPITDDGAGNQTTGTPS